MIERFWLEALLFAGAAFAVSYGLTRAAVRVLPRLGLVSTPDPNHPEPVPLSGGIAVWIAVGLSLLFLGASGHPVGSIGLIFVGSTIRRIVKLTPAIPIVPQTPAMKPRSAVII